MILCTVLIHNDYIFIISLLSYELEVYVTHLDTQGDLNEIDISVNYTQTRAC